MEYAGQVGLTINAVKLARKIHRAKFSYQTDKYMKSLFIAILIAS